MTQVTAVVLTYNRRDLVQRCLRAILEQTRPPDRIVVVDNASSDDTAAVLRRFASDRIETRSLPENVGAAGGFATAMRLGHQTGADFLWVMDDDVIAAPDALAELLRAYEVLGEAAIEAPFVVSTARSPQGVTTNTPEIDRRPNGLAYEDWPHLLAHGLVPVTRSTFVSVLFPRGTIDRHGLPFSSMFMWGEDSEYTLRVTRDVPGYMVGRSRVEHVRALSGAPDIRTERDAVRIGWHRFQIRNNMYISRRYRSRRWTLWHALQICRLALHLARVGQMRKAQAVVSGLVLGLTFSPDV